MTAPTNTKATRGGHTLPGASERAADVAPVLTVVDKAAYLASLGFTVFPCKADKTPKVLWKNAPPKAAGRSRRMTSSESLSRAERSSSISTTKRRSRPSVCL